MSKDAKARSTVFRFKLPLDAIFPPRGVAVIGAADTANSVGRTLQEAP
jgi:hypothetical protein